MFETNKIKFNVESSYDDKMSAYTTTLDKFDTTSFKERKERANKLAREIEVNAEKHGIDDLGTEEELFSAVVRQEVAPPPATSESKPVSKQAHTPSYRQHHPHHHLQSSGPSSGGGGVVTAGQNTGDGNDLKLEAQASNFAGTNSSAHSQVGTNSSLSETDGSQDFHQLHPAADMDTMNVKGGWTSQDSALSLGESEESGDVEKEGVSLPPALPPQVGGNLAPPAQTVAEEEEEEEEEGASEETVEPPQSPPSRAESRTPEQEKEKNVRKFALNPQAKSFSLNPKVAEFVPSFTPQPTSPISQSSSSPALLDSSSYQPANPYSHMSSGKRYPTTKRSRMHTTGATSYADYATPPGGGYVFSPAPQVPQAAALVRNSIQQVQSPQMIQYSSSVPQFVPSSYPTTAGYPQHAVATPQHMSQHVLNAVQKYASEASPQHQVFPGSQQYMNPSQLIQQQVSVSQPHYATTPGGLVTATTPGGLVTAAHPHMMLVQGGISPQGAVGPGGMLSQFQVAGMMPPQAAQAQVMTQNRYIHSTQQPPN